MSKRRNRNKNQTVANNSNNVSNKPEIDYDKLAESIIKAHLEIDKIKLERQEEQENQAWKKYIDSQSSGKPKVWKFLNIIINYNPEKIKTTRTIYFSIKMLTEMTFGFSEFVCFIISILLFLGFLYLGIFYHNWLYLFVMPFSILFVMYGFFFRMAKKEIEQIKDNSQLIGIFSSMTCFVAMVVSLISMIIAVIGLLMQMNII